MICKPPRCGHISLRIRPAGAYAWHPKSGWERCYDAWFLKKKTNGVGAKPWQTRRKRRRNQFALCQNVTTGMLWRSWCLRGLLCLATNENWNMLVGCVKRRWWKKIAEANTHCGTFIAQTRRKQSTWLDSWKSYSMMMWTAAKTLV